MNFISTFTSACMAGEIGWVQALVTLNDPVYLEAAQALARRISAAGATPADKARHGFRLCLSRPPAEAELSGLLNHNY